MTPEAELIALCAGDIEPILEADELAQCLIESAVPDSDGLYLNDEDWTPTYDMNRPASKAWRLKAAKIAGDYSITVEGRELNRSQMYENFMNMSREYARLAQPRYFGAPGEDTAWRV